MSFAITHVCLYPEITSHGLPEYLQLPGKFLIFKQVPVSHAKAGSPNLHTRTRRFLGGYLAWVHG